MIDNIVLLITGTLHQRAINDLLPRCHPLGSFEQLGAITVADTPAQLYTAVLVDTPLGIEINNSINNMFLFLLFQLRIFLIVFPNMILMN